MSLFKIFKSTPPVTPEYRWFNAPPAYLEQQAQQEEVNRIKNSATTLRSELFDHLRQTGDGFWVHTNYAMKRGSHVHTAVDIYNCMKAFVKQNGDDYRFMRVDVTVHCAMHKAQASVIIEKDALDTEDYACETADKMAREIAQSVTGGTVDLTAIHITKLPGI